MKRRDFMLTVAALGAAPGAQAAPASVALVLGGGGCRGYGHIVILRALEANGLKLDLVVGSGAGSLVGALFAAGLDSGGVLFDAQE